MTALSSSLDDALHAVVQQRVADEVARLLREREERDEGFLGVRAAAEYLGLSEDAVRSKIKRGELPAHRRGGRIFLCKRELRAWVIGA